MMYLNQFHKEAVERKVRKIAESKKSPMSSIAAAAYMKKNFEKAKTMSLSQLNNLLTQMLPMLTTDLSDSEIFGYAVQLFPLLTDLQINTMRIPADGAYQMTMIDGMSVLLPNLEANRKLLADIMAE